MNDKKSPMQRRLRFSLLILISQILLVALAISWLAHMGTIAVSGSVYFVENNPWILWTEISVSVVITVFAILILVMQIQRLGERRGHERREDRQDTQEFSSGFSTSTRERWDSPKSRLS